MSFDGGGDDDINDRLRELTSELQELNRLLRGAMTEAEGEGGDADPAPEEADLWRIGTTSPMVTSETEYRRLRITASNDTEINAPYFGPNVYDSYEAKIEGRLDMFREGYDSLQSVEAALAGETFKDFVQALADDWLGQFSGFAQPFATELMELFDPGPGFFGISIVNNEVSVNSSLSPLDFLQAYGDIWYSNTQPWNTLRKGPQPPDVKELRGNVSVGEINRKMAIEVFNRRSLTLPADYVELLPESKQAEWRERNM